MNEQLQKALADILTMLQSSAQVVGDAAQAEVPLLVQEYLRWGIFDAVLWAALWIGIGGGLIRFGRQIAAIEDGYGGLDGERVFFSRYIFPLSGWLIVIVGVISNLYQLLQVLFAPRVYLLETVLRAVR